MFFIYSGLISGLLMGLGLGNVKILIIKSTIEKSISAGIRVLIGVVLSDLLLISTVQFADKLINWPSNYNKYVFLIFGLFFIAFSVFQLILFFKNNSEDKWNTSIHKSSNTPILSGFLYNTLNPYNYLTWVGFNVFVNKYGGSLADKLIFFASILIMMVLVDSIIIFHINKISLLMRMKKYLTLINSLVFLIIGIKLLG